MCLGIAGSARHNAEDIVGCRTAFKAAGDHFRQAPITANHKEHGAGGDVGLSCKFNQMTRCVGTVHGRHHIGLLEPFADFLRNSVPFFPSRIRIHEHVGGHRSWEDNARLRPNLRKLRPEGALSPLGALVLRKLEGGWPSIIGRSGHG